MSFLFDHRQLAEEMGIFVFNDELGAGLPLWLPAGAAIRDQLERFVREKESRRGYERVVSPHLGKASLYERSGHLRFYRESMFPPLRWPEGREEFYLRPMNCPHHHLAFASRPRSYRSLPCRLAEYGQVYRWENSGSLQGLARARGLCQNDAHIYVAPEEALAELKDVLLLFEECYRELGISGYRYRLSKHDPAKPGSYEGDGALWLKHEAMLRQALAELALPFYEAEDEAAFYGPKIDVQMRLGQKEESIASVQLDFLSAERFDLSYVAADGRKERPLVIHRAPLGSHERFVAMLLELHEGRLPGWLAPVQLLIIPVGESEVAEARRLRQQLLAEGIRAEVEPGQGSLAKRIRLAHRLRPFAMLVLGPRELESGLLRLQLRGEELSVWKVNLADQLHSLLAHPAKGALAERLSRGRGPG